MLTFPSSLLLIFLNCPSVWTGRQISSQEMKKNMDLFIQKNRHKLQDGSFELGTGKKKQRFMQEDEYHYDYITVQTPTTFYGPYYMHNGRVYRRKSYTKEPTSPTNCSQRQLKVTKQAWVPRAQYFSKPIFTKKVWSAWTRKVTTPRNKSTFYGPYYMYKGKLISRKHYTKEPTKFPPPKTSRGRHTTIPYWNRTTSYGPFFMFKNKVYSRKVFTKEPTIKFYAWMKTNNTNKWTGVYPFTRFRPFPFEKITIPNCVRKKPAAMVVRDNPSFEELAESNPSIMSDFEVSNDTSLAIKANAYISKHFNFQQFVDSEMYLTMRPTIAQTYKHGFFFNKYPTMNWKDSDQNVEFLQEIRRSVAHAWTLEMLRFSYDPNYSTTPIVRPPWVPHSDVERYYC